MTTEVAILIGAALATLGWLYTGRKARTLARKQHTINLMVQAAFNKDFRDALTEISPYIRAKNVPDLANDENKALRASFRIILNHYEFVSAGLRSGDFDERLFKNSERGTILTLYEACEDYIYKVRDSRRRQRIYEHLEWVHKRWQVSPPSMARRAIEYWLGRPIAGRRTPEA